VSIPPENADALDLLHQWQSEDPAYDREAWARLTGARVTEQDAITFDAVIPSNMSALRIHGESGMRITLDVDETNLPEALKLVLWRERVLRVTIEPESGDGRSESGKPRTIHI